MNYIQARTLQCANYMLQNNSTVRKTAQKYNLAKSTLHSDIHKYLPYIDADIYKRVCKLLEINYKEKHIRGGQSTKQKYLNKKK